MPRSADADSTFTSVADLLQAFGARDLTALTVRLEEFARLSGGLVLRQVGDRLGFMAGDETGVVDFPVTGAALARRLNGEDAAPPQGRRVSTPRD